VTARRSKAWPLSKAVDWRRTHRLIIATYADEDPYFARLADGADDIATLTELAGATNARLAAQSGQLPAGIGPDELLFAVPFSRIINAAYTYPSPAGSRFSDNTRGAWYAAQSVRTSLAEVTFHRTLLLAETDWWVDTVDYQEFLADISADQFADLTDGDRRSLACLAPDSYVEGQALGRQLLEDGWSGVVYPSVRHALGMNIACFRPALVSHVQVGNRYRLEWSGNRKPKVGRLH
jgi:RES domain-containing protein